MPRKSHPNCASPCNKLVIPVLQLTSLLKAVFFDFGHKMVRDAYKPFQYVRDSLPFLAMLPVTVSTLWTYLLGKWFAYVTSVLRRFWLSKFYHKAQQHFFKVFNVMSCSKKSVLWAWWTTTSHWFFTSIQKNGQLSRLRVAANGHCKRKSMKKRLCKNEAKTCRHKTSTILGFFGRNFDFFQATSCAKSTKISCVSRFATPVAKPEYVKCLVGGILKTMFLT